jgi:phosphate uptake regulator
MNELPHLAAIRSVQTDSRSSENLRTTQLLRERTHGGVALSLPPDWVEEMGWREGTLLSITRLSGGRFLVALERDPRPVPPVTLDLSEQSPQEHLFRRLVSAYLGGTDEITVRSSFRIAPNHLLVVREFVRRVPEFHVTFETKDRLVLRGTSGPLTSDPAALLRGMHRRVLNLQREAGQSWSASGAGTAGSAFVALDDEVDREAWLMERTLVRGWAQGMYFGLTSADASIGVSYLMVAKTLERIADHGVRIGEEGRHLAGASPELLRPLGDLHDRVLELLAAAGDVLERPDPVQANQIIDGVESAVKAREAIAKLPLKVLRGKGSRGSLVLPVSAILESIVRTASYVADLGEIALDLQANR